MSNPLANKMPRILHRSVTSAMYSAFSALGRCFAFLLFSDRPLFHTLPYKFLVHQNACFLGLYFFGGRKEYPWTLPSIKSPNSLLTFLSASSICSTMQDILLQKSAELKIESRRSFTQSQKSSPVTWPSEHEFGPPQSSSSSLDLCHYVHALLQQHHLVLRVV